MIFSPKLFKPDMVLLRMLEPGMFFFPWGVLVMVGLRLVV